MIDPKQGPLFRTRRNEEPSRACPATSVSAGTAPKNKNAGNPPVRIETAFSVVGS
jgi:hypothetical protein